MRRTRLAPIALAALTALASPACAQGGDEPRPVEATSLLGEPLRRPVLTDDQREKLEADLDAARAELAAHPDDEMAWIWVGRRLGYLGRYNDAIEHYTQAIEKFPDSYKLYRHRGHRYITIREFDKARIDLYMAVSRLHGHEDEPEPDGIPNEQNIPRSTTKTNILYHWGLSHYLLGRYDDAAREFEWCARVSDNDDMRVAALYWAVLSHLRKGDQDEVLKITDPITAEMDVIENHAYHRLLLLFRGDLGEDDLLEGLEPGSIEYSTIAYGVAQFRLWNADERGCREMLEQIVKDDMWPAFGHIAAESDLARERSDD